MGCLAAASYVDLRRIKDWSLTSLKEKLIKIGAKVVSHRRHVARQMVGSQSRDNSSPTSCG